MPKRHATTTRAASGSTSRSSLIRTAWSRELTWSSTCWRNLASAIRWALAQDGQIINLSGELCLTLFCVCVCVFLKAPAERNYHIFYCLLSGMPKEHKNALSLGDATEFSYLTEVWTSTLRPQTESLGQDALYTRDVRKVPALFKTIYFETNDMSSVNVKKKCS